ncbi:Hint domain-containing protein [Pukyongiella litopenaei]|uniref:Hint domain-containing protein n=1 Tax=Pukyongiella litopenaei TaxID=2605946 RepID=A0A2S0MPF0_9RHOB|nr:Hint domain-containing protein [Pukyongiella litopenaei]AVO37716.1 Hint domain-containing protein [Pukyongiella litopenaei]
MATSYTSFFYVMDPANPPGHGTSLFVREFEFIDHDDDGRISPGDRFEGALIRNVWNGDEVTVNVPGQGPVTYAGVTFYIDGGPPVFIPTDGQALQDGTLQDTEYVTVSTWMDVNSLVPSCFTPGVLIDTAHGSRPVERIAVGDLVLTADAGLQRVAWTGCATVAARGGMAPVRIAAGTLGNTRDLLVSPQHRILIEGWAAEVFAGIDGVLVPARHLVDGDRIRIVESRAVTYLHLGFDRHHLVRSEGIWTESHFASAAARAEAAALFGAAGPVRTVRPEAPARESRLIAGALLN